MSGRSRSRGQATVELAVVLPLILGLLLVLVQVGLVLRDQLLVVHATREGARAAAVAPDPAAVRRAVADAGGLDPSRLEVAVRRTGPGSRFVEVTVRYHSATDVPVVGGFTGDVVLTEKLTARLETG